MTKFRKQCEGLPACRCCGARPDIVPYADKGSVMIICSKNGCISVIGKNYADAVRLWKEPRFTDQPILLIHHPLTQ